MKQLFLLAVLCFLFSTTTQAQNCPYSKAAVAANATTATQAAAMEDSVEKRFDEVSGQTTFVRKAVCPTSGKVSYTLVEYCSKSGKFVNVSPHKKQCIKSKAECASKSARATKVSNAEKAGCTAAQKAACAKACAKAKADNSDSGASAVKAKLVKN